jgi:hypothetical protein
LTPQALPIHRQRMRTDQAPTAERHALLVLRVAATAAMVLSVILLAVMPSHPVTANVPGFTSPVIGFELASEPAHVLGILGTPGMPARAETVRRMDLGNRIDFLFMVAYPALYVGIALLLAARGRVRGATARVLLFLPVLMALGDALENRQLLVLSATVDPAAMTAPLAALGLFTRLKWYAIYLESALVAPFIWREAGWWRWSAPVFGTAALLGLASVVHLPALEYGANVVGVAWVMTLVRSYRS